MKDLLLCARNVAPVAVLMCVYAKDNPNLIARAIASIVEQTYNGEVRIYLCIDGAVPDSINEVLRMRRADIYLQIENRENIGLAASLNRLIDHLHDEAFVFRMDADDFSLPDRFTETIKFMQDEHVDVCGSWIEEVHVKLGERVVVRYPRDHKSAIRSLMLGSPFAHPTVCFRRDVLRKFPAYPLRRSNEDIAFWFLLAEAGFQFGNVQSVLLQFSVDGNFFRRRSRSKAVEELQVYLHGLYKLHGISFALLPPVARFCVRLMPASFIQRAYNLRWLIGR